MPSDDMLVLPYWDPKLRFNKKSYNNLVSRLHDIGMFNYTTKPLCSVGVFFVWKSSRTRLRMITDARRANQMFRDPPGVSLMTGEGFGRIEIEFDAAVANNPDALSALEFHVGLSDVKDCFHRLRVPAWMSRYFCWLPVAAKVVGLAGKEIDGKVLQPLDPVWPCAGSLCQGFTWSLYFAQKANEFQCSLVNPLADGLISNDRGGPIVFHVGADVDPALHYYVYVDNLGVIDTDVKRVEEAMMGLQQSFNSQGLTLHSSEISSGAVDSLGCVVEGSKLRSRINPKRLWKVHQAILGLLRRGRCTGRTVEVVVGHLTFCGLMNRLSLSCFSSVYPFIRKNYSIVAKIWTSVERELRAFCGLLFLMVQDWSRPWNELVSSSDASLSGFGVCHAWWPRDEVAKTGRRLERSRFRRTSGHSARASALQAAGLELNAGLWTKSNVSAAKKLAESGWEVDEGFAEVPAAGLRRPLWSPKIWGKWSYPDNILLLEAKTVLKGIKRILLTRFGHDMRQLVLCDNMSVVLSIERCRARNYRLLVVIRKIAAFCFARNVHLAIRWIPSELNVSDEPSRIDGPEESKILVDLIVDDWAVGSFSSQSRDGPKNAHPRFESPAANTCSSNSRSGTEGKKKEGTELAELVSHQPVRGPFHADQETGRCRIPGEKAERPEGDSLKTAHVRGSAEDVANDEKQANRSQRRRERQHFVRMRGREQRRQVSHCCRQAKKTASDHSLICHDGTIRCFDAPGGCHNLQTGQRQLQQQVEGSHPFCGEEWTALCERPRYRLCLSDLLQCQVCGGGGGTPWGLCSGCFHGSCPGVREIWEPEDTTRLAEFERMEKVVSFKKPPGLSPASLVCNLMADGLHGACSEGCFQFDAGEHIPASWLSPEVEEDGAREAYTWHHGQLVGGNKPFRDQRHLEDWHKGRQHSDGLAVASLLGATDEPAIQGQAPGTSLELRLQRVPISLSRMLPEVEAEHCAVSSKAQWAQHRPCPVLQNSGGSQKKRGLDEQKQCCPVRKGREAGSNMANPGSSCAVDLPVGGALPRGDYARPRLSKHSTSLNRSHGRYFCDFFSGKGGVARAARALGFNAREWELLQGDNHDLTRRAVLSKIRFDIRNDTILAAMLAPPCSSFSIARDRTMVIRSRAYPWGLPGLPEHEQHKVEVGNRCFQSAFKIIRWLDQHAIPWILENPHSSKCWFLPPMQKLMSSPHTQVIVVDFCQYGTKWRKRTRLLAGNVEYDDIQRLIQHRCVGTKGICTRTGRRHFQLTGSNKKGIPYTRLAQPYPSGLCHDLAHALLAPRLLVPHGE